MRKNILVWLVATTILTSIAEAQQNANVYRVGYIGTSRRQQSQNRIDAFESALRGHGYVVGKNLSVEYRFAEGKFARLPEIAAELVRLNVDVIVTGVNPSTVAAQRATSTIPIVMAFGNDPVGTGLVASLARPGGNITGFSIDTGAENFGKRLELLKEAVDKLSRVAVLFNSANAAHQLYLKNLEPPAGSLKVALLPVGYRVTGDFDNAFKSMAAQQVGAMFLFSDGVSFDQRAAIASLAVKHRLASSYPASEYVDAGGLMSYGPDLNNNMRRAAGYVDKILKGAKPAELPVEQPMKFEFVVNLNTAKQIGLTIPPNVLYRADKVVR